MCLRIRKLRAADAAFVVALPATDSGFHAKTIARIRPPSGAQAAIHLALLGAAARHAERACSRIGGRYGTAA